MIWVPIEGELSGQGRAQVQSRGAQGTLGISAQARWLWTPWTHIDCAANLFINMLQSPRSAVDAK